MNVKKLSIILVLIILLLGIGEFIYQYYHNSYTLLKKVKKINTKKIILKPKVNITSSTPLGGDIYICDSKNNRIIEVNPAKQIVWQMDGIKDPDDVQVYAKNRIIVNQEDYSRVVEINTQTKQIVWSYGHLGIPGSAPGYLGEYVDDSFRLPDGNTIITDDVNMRVIAVNRLGEIVWQYGVTGVRSNAQGYLNAPNDAMPQTNGTILITNIGNHSAIDVNEASRAIEWTVNLPQSYPSDALVLPNGNILSTDWVSPGKVDEVTRTGQVVWSYQPTGVNALNHPSSTQVLPNGNYLIVDDHNDRVFVINPKSKQILWQYGVTGQAGIGFNLLNDPSGVALAKPMLSPAF